MFISEGLVTSTESKGGVGLAKNHNGVAGDFGCRNNLSKLLYNME